MAPSQELGLNVQFNRCCVLSYGIEVSQSASRVGQARLYGCDALYGRSCAAVMSDLVSFANVILLL